MILSTNESALIKYCSGPDHEDDSEDEDEDDDGDKPTKGGKRKASAVPKGRGRPPKKAKAVAAQSLTYMLRSRCRETGEGMIHYQDEEGTITFKDKTLVSFTADAALPCVGRNVKFVGRKISDELASSSESWNDYSERAYERERVGRWR
ncbi:hypothetical protein PFICI_00940 [Pestalotiopsis fici W106-1]|uniref:Uncharacterized protein n=1 Tax=Pestalotiopsis fici (strain W106-1 / CGMCC3.15140) TaxID=1229662 RepID=W3XNM3_PESFW|nr:uncharacterized protein PFICI_00940 [Pestalotiopsis fici W106-1]ETS87112.1 hypothetical protein PFICI_00940 [Pestalotiopsis fici W106-1]